jgi:hypothetical protein
MNNIRHCVLNSFFQKRTGKEEGASEFTKLQGWHPGHGVRTKQGETHRGLHFAALSVLHFTSNSDSLAPKSRHILISNGQTPTRRV